MNVRDAQYGFGSWRPTWGDPLNTPACFTAVFTVSTFLLTYLLSLNSILLDTIERHFSLSSLKSGLLIAVTDLAGVLSAALFSQLCDKVKVRWLAAGNILFILGVAILIGAQKLVDTSSLTFTGLAGNDSGLVLANGCLDTSCQESMNAGAASSTAYGVLILAYFLQGIGITPQTIFGVTYIDEIYHPEKVAFVLALQGGIALIGYPVSAFMGGWVLKRWFALGPPPPGLSPDSPGWIGAWWFGFVVGLVPLALVTVPLAGFPRRMPAAEEVTRVKQSMGIRGHFGGRGGRLPKTVMDTTTLLRRLLANKALMFLILGDIVQFLQIAGFVLFTPKFMMHAFNLGSNAVGIYMCIIYGVSFPFGSLMGGLFTKVFKMSGKQAVLFMSLTTLFSSPLLLANMLYCPQTPFAGLSVNYQQGNVSGVQVIGLVSECNSGCECSTNTFSPVCGADNVTYFSPCFAGCVARDTGYCKCLPPTLPSLYPSSNSTRLPAMLPGSATEGQCPTEECQGRLVVYLMCAFLYMFLRFMAYPPHQIAYLRVVGEGDRESAQALKMVSTKLFGQIPGPILLGLLVDKYCYVWRKGCTEDASCWIYDMPGLTHILGLVYFVLIMAASLLFLLCWYNFPQPSLGLNTVSPSESEQREDTSQAVRHQ